MRSTTRQKARAAAIEAIYADGVFASCVPCKGDGCARCGWCGQVQVVDGVQFTVDGSTQVDA